MFIKDYLKFYILLAVLLIAGFSNAYSCEQKGELKNTAEIYLKKSECHEYSLNAQAADYLEIIARQRGVDVKLTLLKEKVEIKSADSENANSGYEFIVLLAPETAKYKIRIDWLDDNQMFVGNEGAYKLDVENHTATEQDRLFVEKYENAGLLYTKATSARQSANRNAINEYRTATSIYKLFPQNRIFRYRLVLANYYLAVFYNSIQNYDEAISILQENIALASDIQDDFLKSLSLKELGVAFQKKGEFQRSADILETALPILEKLNLEKIGERSVLPGAYLALSESLFNLNKTEKAITLLEALRLNHKESIEEYLKASIKLTDVYLDLGNKEKAGQILRQAVLPENTREDIKGHFNKVSGKFYLKTDKEKAVRFFTKAFSNFSGNEREQTEVKMFTGNALYYAQDFQAAKTYYEQAKSGFEQQGDRLNLAQVLNNLSVIHYFEKDIPTAISLCENALMINTEIANELNKARNLINLMYFQESKDNKFYGIFYGKWAINTIRAIKFGQLQNLEKEIQETFQDSFTDAFRKLAALLIKEGRISEAEQVLRFIKEKEYYDYVRGNGDFGKIEYSKSEEEIFSQIKNKIKKQLGNSPDDPIKDKKSTETLSPTKQLIKNLEFQNVKVSELAFVSTLVAKDSVSIIFTTSAKQKVFTQKIARETLNKLVAEFRDSLTDIDKNPQIAGKKLYDLLVKPLETELTQIGRTKIIWSLDGVLRYVSISALYDGQNYLVNRFANIQITLASSEKMLFPKVSNPTAIGLASSKAFENLSSLPGAKNELDCIFEDGKKLIINSTCKKGLIKGEKFADEEFTKEKFEDALKNYQLIHFTSHFVLQAGDNSKSFLLLGGGINRKYTMRDFSLQRLDNVEMIIMSACDTANFSSSGAEFESFVTMAQKQGTKAILGTLWSVADISTSKFMREFYWFYQIKKMDKAEAVRKAQISVAGDKRFAHPFYWAPFVLFGNWK